MSIYDLKITNREGKELSLENYKGKTLIIVNTATGCGFTPQYEGLEKLYEEYHNQGLEILDFPCNQFGHQAPGTDDEIHEFCTAKYQTQFDQLSKIEVNGENEHPLYTYLKKQQLSTTYKNKEDIKWNFTKFLVDKNGNVVKRYDPTFDPKNIEKDLKEII